MDSARPAGICSFSMACMLQTGKEAMATISGSIQDRSVPTSSVKQESHRSCKYFTMFSIRRSTLTCQRDLTSTYLPMDKVLGVDDSINVMSSIRGSSKQPTHVSRFSCKSLPYLSVLVGFCLLIAGTADRPRGRVLNIGPPKGDAGIGTQPDDVAENRRLR